MLLIIPADLLGGVWNLLTGLLGLLSSASHAPVVGFVGQTQPGWPALSGTLPGGWPRDGGRSLFVVATAAMYAPVTTRCGRAPSVNGDWSRAPVTQAAESIPSGTCWSPRPQRQREAVMSACHRTRPAGTGRVLVAGLGARVPTVFAPAAAPWPSAPVATPITAVGVTAGSAPCVAHLCFAVVLCRLTLGIHLHGGVGLGQGAVLRFVPNPCCPKP